MGATHEPQEMNQEQVRGILRFIEENHGQEIKESVFGELGRQCFYARGLDKWIGQFTQDVQRYLDRVNVEKKSRYWEQLEFADARTLVLTGKPVEGCACVFAHCPNPPLSLCHHCCKAFQEELFGTLLGRTVEVTIDQAFLLGDERCSTRIRLM
jgi:hypothetical protein